MKLSNRDDLVLIERICALQSEADCADDMVQVVLCDLALGSLQEERRENYDEATPLLVVARSMWGKRLTSEHIIELEAMGIETMTRAKAIELCAKALR